MGVAISFVTKNIPLELENIKIFAKIESKQIFIKKDRFELDSSSENICTSINNWHIRDIQLLDVEYDSVTASINDKERNPYGFLKSEEWDNEEETCIRLTLEVHKNIAKYDSKTNKVEHTKPDEKYLYIELPNEIIENIKVIINPWATNEFKKQVEDLFIKHNIPTHQIKDSCLKGKVRER